MIEQIQTELPIWLAPIGLVLAIFLSWLSYSGPRSKELFSLTWRWILGSIRAVAFFLVILLLIGVLWKIERSIEEKPQLLIAVDQSLSINSFLDSLQIDKTLTTLSEQIDDQYIVVSYGFGETVVDYESDRDAFETTNFTTLFSYLNRVYANQAVDELLLISDGIYTAGADPALAAEAFPYPVSVWALGDTTRYPDIRITGVQANDVVYADSPFPVEILIASDHAAGESVKVVV